MAPRHRCNASKGRDAHATDDDGCLAASGHIAFMAAGSEPVPSKAPASDDDEVIAELPVYVCNEFMGSATQLSLFQHPLRPPWRPYEYGKVKHIRMKPNARRVEVDLPLDVRSRNYNDIIEDFKKINKVTLRSQQVDSKTSLAIGTVQDGKLLLVPVDYSLQLRPALSHLNIGNTKKGKDEEEEEEEDEPVMRAVEVQVQKRETERQQQARLNSFAHLSAKEEEESWVNLALHTADSRPAESIWDRFVLAKDTHIAVDMNRPAYLRAFVPSVGGQQNQTEAGDAAGGEAQAGGSGLTADPLGDVLKDPVSRAAAEQLSPERSKALETSLKLLFSKFGVCTMGNIRQWLQDPSSNSGPAKEMGIMTDRTLHEALMETGLLTCIRRVYVMKATGNAGTDPLRSVVIELLNNKETFKRAEVLEAAQRKNITVTDTMYNRVVKDMCQSRGLQWSLKNGADLQ